MTRVLRIEPTDHLFARAERALWEEERCGRLPIRWRMGREVMDRIRNQPGVQRTEALDSLLGVPLEYVPTAPPTMLELDVF